MERGIKDILDEKRIVVCLGSGGAGKTTISAALALQGTIMGKNTLALTIDPSRRLATSMGLDTDLGEITTIENKRIRELGMEPKGRLDVELLDVKATFDDLVNRLAPTPYDAHKILANNYYRTIADSLSGSHEYMAMEALLTAYEGGDYDLIAVDTPPARHFLDFLSAPRRLIELLDAPQLRWLVRSGSLANRLTLGMSRLWSNIVLKVLERIVGVEVLRDIWYFFMDIECINEPLKERARQTFRVLKSGEAVFFIVTRPDEPSLEDTAELYKKLSREGYDVGGIIVNRLFGLDAESDDGSALGELLTAYPQLAPKIEKCWRDYLQMEASEDQTLQRLKSEIGAAKPIKCLPQLDEEVYDLRGLSKVREALFES